jgi:flagellar export protein FliJ
VAKKKLESVRKVYSQQEKQLIRELSELREQRAEQRSQAERLKEMLTHYRGLHMERSSLTAGEIMRLSSFYQKVSGALDAQESYVTRLDMAYEGKRAQWHGAYRQRRAMEQVLEKAADRERTEARRKERRQAGTGTTRGTAKGSEAGSDGNGDPGSGRGSWAMLNED